jgi:hypothetical protein
LIPDDAIMSSLPLKYQGPIFRPQYREGVKVKKFSPAPLAEYRGDEKCPNRDSSDYRINLMGKVETERERAD